MECCSDRRRVGGGELKIHSVNFPSILCAAWQRAARLQACRLPCGYTARPQPPSAGPPAHTLCGWEGLRGWVPEYGMWEEVMGSVSRLGLKSPRPSMMPLLWLPGLVGLGEEDPVGNPRSLTMAKPLGNRRLSLSPWMMGCGRGRRATPHRSMDGWKSPLLLWFQCCFC